MVAPVHGKLRAVVTALAFLLVAPASSTARAAECDPAGLSSCIDSDTFWPHAGPQSFVATGGSETTAAKHVSFGLVTSYQARPLVLTTPSPGPPGSLQRLVDHQVNGTFLFAYGVVPRLELDVALPVTFAQTGTGITPVTGGPKLQDTALRDLRFGATVALVQHARVQDDGGGSRLVDGAGLAARFLVVAPTGDGTQFAGDRAAVFAPSLAFDYRSGRFLLGAEIGARIRAVSELLGARVGTQFPVSAAASVDVLRRPELLTFGLEARVLPSFVDQATVAATPLGTTTTPNASIFAPAEWMASVRTAPFLEGDVSFLASGGTSLGTDAITAPRYRFALGLRYAPTAKSGPKRAPVVLPPDVGGSR